MSMNVPSKLTPAINVVQTAAGTSLVTSNVSVLTDSKVTIALSSSPTVANVLVNMEQYAWMMAAVYGVSAHLSTLALFVSWADTLVCRICV